MKRRILQPLRNACFLVPLSQSILLGNLSGCFHQPPLRKERDVSTMPHHASRQLLVAFTDLPALIERKAIWDRFNLIEIEQVGKNALILVEAPVEADAASLEKIRKALTNEKGVRYAEPNVQMRIFK